MTTYNNVLGGYLAPRPAWLQQEAEKLRDKMVMEVVKSVRHTGLPNWDFQDWEFANGVKSGIIPLPK